MDPDARGNDLSWKEWQSSRYNKSVLVLLDEQSVCEGMYRIMRRSSRDSLRNISAANRRKVLPVVAT